MTATKSDDQNVVKITKVESTKVVSKPGAVIKIIEITLTKKAAKSLVINRLPSNKRG